MELLSEGYGIMPNVVLYDKDLTPTQKLIYIIVSSLCAEKGYCRASNSYMWNLLWLWITTVSDAIKILVQKWYLNSKVDKNDGNKRYLTLCQKFDIAIPKNWNSYTKKLKDIITIDNYKWIEKEIIKENSLNSLNDTPSNDSRGEIINWMEISQELIDKYWYSMIEDFTMYRGECNKKWVSKWELQKTWDLWRRLATWKKNADTNFWKVKTYTIQDYENNIGLFREEMKKDYQWIKQRVWIEMFRKLSERARHRAAENKVL